VFVRGGCCCKGERERSRGALKRGRAVLEGKEIRVSE